MSKVILTDPKNPANRHFVAQATADTDPAYKGWTKASAAEGGSLELRIAKDALRVQVNALRDAKRDGGLMVTNLGPVQTDPLSRSAIQDLAAEARAAGALPVQFILANNERVPLQPAEVVALHVAVGRHVRRIGEAAQTHKELIEAAASLADLNLLNISTGWPGGALSLNVGA